jgi:hypothetical protein
MLIIEVISETCYGYLKGESLLVNQLSFYPNNKWVRIPAELINCTPNRPMTPLVPFPEIVSYSSLPVAQVTVKQFGRENGKIHKLRTALK